MKPYKLIKGSSIGIISPAGPVKKEELKDGKEILKKVGFHIKEGANIYALSKHYYMAGSDKIRVHDLHCMFTNKEIKAIICSRGGYGSIRMLEYIDYKNIERNPKIFVGYSDITAIIIAIYKKTGLITFHGPVLRDFHRLPYKDIEWLINMIQGKVNKIHEDNFKSIISGKSQGILLGGNLSIICHLIGTPFLPLKKEIILFLEDTNEPYYKIDRMLTHLRISGFLDNVSGLILGSFEGCGKMDVIEQIVLEKISNMGIPVISGLALGHGKRNMTVPVGIKVELDAYNKEIKFLEQPVI